MQRAVIRSCGLSRPRQILARLQLQRARFKMWFGVCSIHGQRKYLQAHQVSKLTRVTLLQIVGAN